MKQLVAVLLLLLTLLVGCAQPSQSQGITWDGEALQGTTFFNREAKGVTVHYALPTSPLTAERAVDVVTSVLGSQDRYGRVYPDTRMDIWVVPEGYQWPAGAAAPPPGRQARALRPQTVIVTEAGLSQSGTTSGLAGAVALSLVESADSPAYAVDWLHEGMGAILASGWAHFLSHFTGTGEQLATLESATAPPQEWQFAAQRLAALLLDRWGYHWSRHYPKQPDEMTPARALAWATGTEDREKGLALWQERVDYFKKIEPGKYFQYEQGIYLMTANDMSPVRVKPDLAQLPKGSSPNDNYSPHSYDLSVRYDPAMRLVEGTEKLTWQNGEGIPVDTLYFNLWPNAEQFALWDAGMTIHEVQVDGKAAPFKAQALDLVVPLGRPLAEGERTEVTIRFTTLLPNVITPRDFGQDTVQEKFNLSHWFPSLAVLDDRGWILHPMRTRAAEPYSENTHFKVTIDVPKEVLLGATGRQVGKREVGDRLVYEYDAKNVKDFVVTGGTNLREHVFTVDGVTIRIFERDEKWIQAMEKELTQAMQIFNRKFGPYPYQDLVVGCCVGMEYPGLIFGTPINSVGSGTYWSYVAIHELGHQWFYGMVGNDQYSEPWLDEGFTTYADRIAQRQMYPDRRLGDLNRNRALYAGPRISGSSGDFAAAGELNLGSAYSLGALVLEDLEQLIGTEQMDALVKEWVRRYTFKTATTPEFMRFTEEFTGRDLDEFFEQHLLSAEDRGPVRDILPVGQAVPLVTVPRIAQ